MKSMKIITFGFGAGIEMIISFSVPSSRHHPCETQGESLRVRVPLKLPKYLKYSGVARQENPIAQPGGPRD